MYYGLSFGAGNLGGSVLMANFLNGFVEFVCFLFLPFLIDLKIIGRKYGIIITMGIGAIGFSNLILKLRINSFSLGCFLTGLFGSLSEKTEDKMDQLHRIFAIIGKFGVSGTFGILYIHASE